MKVRPDLSTPIDIGKDAEVSSLLQPLASATLRRVETAQVKHTEATSSANPSQPFRRIAKVSSAVSGCFSEPAMIASFRLEIPIPIPIHLAS